MGDTKFQAMNAIGAEELDKGTEKFSDFGEHLHWQGFDFFKPFGQYSKLSPGTLWNIKHSTCYIRFNNEVSFIVLIKRRKKQIKVIEALESHLRGQFASVSQIVGAEALIKVLYFYKFNFEDDFAGIVFQGMVHISFLYDR
jgi:hypothetical protein